MARPYHLFCRPGSQYTTSTQRKESSIVLREKFDELVQLHHSAERKKLWHRLDEPSTDVNIISEELVRIGDYPGLFSVARYMFATPLHVIHIEATTNIRGAVDDILEMYGHEKWEAYTYTGYLNIPIVRLSGQEVHNPALMLMKAEEHIRESLEDQLRQAL